MEEQMPLEIAANSNQRTSIIKSNGKAYYSPSTKNHEMSTWEKHTCVLKKNLTAEHSCITKYFWKKTQIEA